MSVSWRSDELLPRCGRESHHPAEGALRTPSEFGDPLVISGGRESCTQQSGPPGLRLSCPGEREKHNVDGHKSGGQYFAVLFGLQLPLTHTNLSNKVRGIFFLKKSSLILYSLRQYVFCMYMCIYAYLSC